MAGNPSSSGKNKKQHRKSSKGQKAAKKKKSGKSSSLGSSLSDVASVGASGAPAAPAASAPASAPASRTGKAFGFSGRGRAKAAAQRSAEKEQRKLHAPVVQDESSEPPPMVVVVQGAKGVGKSTLIRSLVRHFVRQNLREPLGPITVVSGKKRRITIIECPSSDLNAMLDLAKVADLALLVVDAHFGLEMETFEFLNMLQTHGFPKIMGVLSHCDLFKKPATARKARKELKRRFWTEVFDGAKLFHLGGMQHGRYLKRDVLNLARFISVTKPRPLSWRMAHPYVLADRIEDLTPREAVASDATCDREVRSFCLSTPPSIVFASYDCIFPFFRLRR